MTDQILSHKNVGSEIFCYAIMTSPSRASDLTISPHGSHNPERRRAQFSLKSITNICWLFLNLPSGINKPIVEQLLKTKFFIPTIRPDLVLRPRLFEQLDKGILCKLILVSAPAGYGKTTLISEWVEQLPLDDKKQFRISWLSLDEGDNDVARFLTHLISALNFGQGIEKEIGADALGMLQSPQPPPVEVVLTTLINEIAAITAKTIFILDDYHLIEDQPVSVTAGGL